MTASLRARFVADGVGAAAPQTLLVLLVDRLVLDLGRAEAAQRAHRYEEANSQLQHAQAILVELAEALDTSTWPEGRGLAALYSWLRTELVGANTSRDADRTATARELVEPLADAWREAVTGVPSAPRPAATTTPAATASTAATAAAAPATETADLVGRPFRPPVAAYLGGHP